GVGAEAGVLTSVPSFEDTLGTFSANGYYHFLHGKQHKIDPFATAGYTLLFRDGHLNLFNFGGGANFWLAKHVGARLELRDAVNSQYSTVHYWGVRFGIAIR